MRSMQFHVRELAAGSAGRFEPFDQQGNPVVNPLQPFMSDGSMGALLGEGSFLSNIPIPSFNTDGQSLDPATYGLSPEDLAATQRLEMAVRNNTARLFENTAVPGAAAPVDGSCSVDPIGTLGGQSLSDIANLMNLNGLSSIGGSLGSFGGLLQQRSGDGAAAFDFPANEGLGAPRLTKRQISGREHDDNDPGLHTRIDPTSAATSGRHVRPAAAVDTDSRPSVSPHGNPTVSGVGTAVAAGGNLVPQWLAADPVGGAPPEEGLGMTQLDAYNWTIEEYNSTGLQRTLQRQDYQALLSLAGVSRLLVIC
jgi:hypothetical protein